MSGHPNDNRVIICFQTNYYVHQIEKTDGIIHQRCWRKEFATFLPESCETTNQVHIHIAENITGDVFIINSEIAEAVLTVSMRCDLLLSTTLAWHTL